MMQPEIRKERVKKYGSFLRCPERGNLCFGIDTPDGICKYKTCCLDDPEYIAKQKQIQRNIEENARREWEERRREEKENAAKQIIRRQTKTKEELIERDIARLEAKARHLYRTGKRNAGDAVMHDVTVLYGRLKKLKGA